MRRGELLMASDVRVCASIFLDINKSVTIYRRQAKDLGKRWLARAYTICNGDLFSVGMVEHRTVAVRRDGRQTLCVVRLPHLADEPNHHYHPPWFNLLLHCLF